MPRRSKYWVLLRSIATFYLAADSLLQRQNGIGGYTDLTKCRKWGLFLNDKEGLLRVCFDHLTSD